MPQIVPVWQYITGRAYLAMAVLLFGAAGAVTRRLLDLGALQLIDGRNPLSFCNVLFVGNLCALLTLGVVYGRLKLASALRRLSMQERLLLLGVAVLAGAMAPALFFMALERTDVNNVILIGRIEPPVALALGIFFLKERANIWVISGSVLAFAGGVLTIVLQAYGPEAATVSMAGFQVGQGELMAVAAAVATAVATVLSQIGLQYIPLGLFAIVRTAIGTVIFFVIVVSLFGVNHFTDVFAPIVWQWMLLYGAVIVAGGQLCWFQGLKSTTTADISLASAFGPLVGILAAYIILNESPTAAQAIGGMIIMAGIALNQVGIAHSSRKRLKQTPHQSMGVGYKGI